MWQVRLFLSRQSRSMTFDKPKNENQTKWSNLEMIALNMHSHRHFTKFKNNIFYSHSIWLNSLAKVRFPVPVCDSEMNAKMQFLSLRKFTLFCSSEMLTISHSSACHLDIFHLVLSCTCKTPSTWQSMFSSMPLVCVVRSPIEYKIVWHNFFLESIVSTPSGLVHTFPSANFLYL